MENENITTVVEEPVVPQVPPVPEKKSNLFKILVVLIGILVVFGLFANAYLMFFKKETVTKTSDSSLLVTPTPDLTADWKTYENTELGFSFEYPQEFVVTEKIVSGETGKAFFIVFNDGKKEQNLMGGINSEYSAGRSGTFFDTQGYRVAENQYFYKFVNNKENLISPSLIQKVYKNSNNVEIIRIIGQSETFETSSPGDPGKGNYGALINLSDKNFTGIAFFHQGENDLLSSEQFDQILSTFKFTP